MGVHFGGEVFHGGHALGEVDAEEGRLAVVVGGRHERSIEAADGVVQGDVLPVAQDCIRDA